MKEVGLYQAKTQLSSLVSAIENTGESFALTRHGKVVAELRPPSRIAPKRGCMKSDDYEMSDDFDSSNLGFEDFWNSEIPHGSGKQ